MKSKTPKNNYGGPLWRFGRKSRRSTTSLAPRLFLALGAGLLASALPGFASSITVTEDNISFSSGEVYYNSAGQMAYTWENPDYDYDTSPPGTISREAVLWDPTANADFHLGVIGEAVAGANGFLYSYARGISNDGWVFGASNHRAFVWKPDTPNGTTSSTGMTALGTLITDSGVPVTDSSYINMVNGDGLAVGYAITSDTAQNSVAGVSYYQDHAFAWTEATGMQRIVTGSEWHGSTAEAVNSSGQVAGIMTSYARSTDDPSDTDDSQHLFLWTQGDGLTDLGELVSGNVWGDASAVGNSWYRGYVNGITEGGLIYGRVETTTCLEVNDVSAVYGVTDTSLFIWKDGDGIQPFLQELDASSVQLYGVSGERFYGSFVDTNRNSALADFLTTRDGGAYAGLANLYGFIWTETEGLRYLDELFADQLLTAEQLVNGTTVGWVAVLAFVGDNDEQMQGFGLWWDGVIIALQPVLLSTLSAVPEPATYAALIGLAMLAYVLVRRRR